MTEEMSQPFMASILLIDDDPALCDLMRDFLGRHDMTVTVAHNGRSGLGLAASQAFDLVLLDITMPGLDGFQVLSELRRVSGVPVLMLTARGEPADRVEGLSAGADDYLAKPFEPMELVARIRAIVRRARGLTDRTVLPPISIGAIRVEPASRRAFAGGHPVELTGVEYEILETLMSADGRSVSRDEISLRLHQRAAGAEDRAIDVHISRIRAKLGPHARQLQTLRGSGYLITASGTGAGA